MLNCNHQRGQPRKREHKIGDHNMIINTIINRRCGLINYDAPAPAATAEKLAIIRKVATRLRRKIKHERLAIVHDRRLGNVNYLEGVEALPCGELGTEDPEPTEILLSVTYGAGLPAEKAEAIEDALLSAVKALPFPPDDIFRGTGDGTKEYTALFIL